MNKNIKLTVFLGLMSLCTQGQTPIFLSGFEGQSLTPDVGTERSQTNDGGNLMVVPNPNPGNRNTSNYVLKAGTPASSSSRAEYGNWVRHPTNNQVVFYKWSEYYPANMFTDIDRNWFVPAQWKTWPCEEYGSGQYDYGDEICESGGIFNDIEWDEGDFLDFRFRANPDCGHAYYDITYDTWNDYVLEVYWTNNQNGYYKLFVNDKLIVYVTDVKTLFDNFPTDNTCDIYFATGVYSNWSNSGSADTLEYYIDNVGIYLASDGNTLEDICVNCTDVATDTLKYYINLTTENRLQNGWANVVGSIDTLVVIKNDGLGKKRVKKSGVYSSNTAGTEGWSRFSSRVTTSYHGATTSIRYYEFSGFDPNSLYDFEIISARNATSSNYYSSFTIGQQNITINPSSNVNITDTIVGIVPDSDSTITLEFAPANGYTYGFLNGIVISEYHEKTECPEITLSADITDEEDGNGSGAIDLTVIGGSAPFTYLWSNSDILEDINNLSEGEFSVIVTDMNGCTATDTFMVDNIVVTLSVDDTMMNDDITISPNPAKYQLDVNIRAVNEITFDLKVFDVIGRIAMERRIEKTAGQSKITIDIENLSAGMYYGVLNTKDTNYHFRFIKMD